MQGVWQAEVMIPIDKTDERGGTLMSGDPEREVASNDTSNPKRRRRRRQKAGRYPLTRQLIETARAARDRGEDASFAIENPRGLFIRVREKDIAYYVQARNGSSVIKRRICPIDDIIFSEIKTIGANAVAAIKNGRNVKVVIESGLAKKDARDTEIAEAEVHAREHKFWTFGETIDQYIARTVVKGGIQKRRLSEPSVREIMDRLRKRPEAADLMDRFVNALDANNFEEVCEKIDKNTGGASPGAKLTHLSQRVLRWAAKYRRLKTGLDPSRPWWNALAHEWKPGDRSGRFLTPSQIGMLIALLEAVRSLEKRSNDAVLGALQLCWMIAQRSGALMCMRSLQSERWENDPVEERRGWRVYTWLADETKGKRDVKLSIPPIAIDILERVSDNCREVTNIESAWTFPQARKKYLLRHYANSDDTAAVRRLDKHVTPSALNHALDSLAGRKPGWPNLLTMVGLPARIGPHDLRRSVTTFFENRGQGSFASALLDHKVTGTDKMDEEVAQVTQGVYSAADRVIFKSEGLALWLAAVVPHCEKAKTDPRLLAAVEARRASLETAKKRGHEKRAKTLEAKRAKKAPR